MSYPESTFNPQPSKKNKKCWIHIGMHKTGSTSIQQNLAKTTSNHTWKLMKTGGRPNMGAALCAMFDDEPQKLFWFKQRKESRESIIQNGLVWKEELLREIHDLNGSICIISSEFVSGFASDTLRRFYDFLRPHFDDIRVIGYVRPPISYCVSQYQEMLKYGHSNFDIDKVHLRYREKFEKFDTIFGKDSVMLRKFDIETFPERCIIRDFCEQVGIRLPEDITIKRRNGSLSREACAILYAYRKYGPSYGEGITAFQENAQLVRGLEAIQGESLSVHHHLMMEMLEDKSEDILWMENRLGSSLREVPSNNENALRNEQDLLRVSRSSCIKFASCFGKKLKCKIPGSWIPCEDPVDPINAAAFIEKCREMARKANDPSCLSENFAEKTGKKPFRRMGIFSRFRKIVKFCKSRIDQITDPPP
jgi:hypothetical protein